MELPASFIDDFSTANDNQTAVILTLFSRNPQSGQIDELGEFHIEVVQPAAQGVPRIQVAITVTESGRVIVIGKNRDTGISAKKEFGPVAFEEQ